MHLPHVRAMPEFALRAVCDISRVNLDHVSARYAPPLATADYHEVLADPTVEAVIVATYEHGEIALAAARAGKHVLIEKPLAFTPAEATAIADAVAEADVVGLVGYMKRYDPAFERFLAETAGLGRIRSARVHDLAGRFDRHHGIYDVSRASDLDPALMRATAARIEEQIRGALGADAGDRHGLLHSLLMLGSHDLAVLRAAFGRIASVPFADTDGDDNVRAMVRTERGVLIELTVGIGARYGWWDEWIGVQDDERAVRLDFPYPYLPNEPGAVSVRTGAERTEAASPYSSAFRRELEHWSACIRLGAAPLTPIADAVADVEAAYDIVRAAARTAD
jgi:predicted dehydrogenase